MKHLRFEELAYQRQVQVNCYYQILQTMGYSKHDIKETYKRYPKYKQHKITTA